MISKLLSTDVLAIHSMDDYVFVGIGCFLHVFKKRDVYELEYKLNFYSNNIHGIVKASNNCIILFGAKCLCIYAIDKIKNTILMKQIIETIWFNDWIIAVKCLTINERIFLIILFAHNNVYVYDISNKKYQETWCEEKCILYGGSISGETIKDVVIFSGTVFQEILIWKLDNATDHDNNAKILHRLIGHKGVIFSVIYDSNTSFICSTSDDRTVRLWKVIKDKSNSLDCQNDIDWRNVEIKLVKTMFGHAARVWRAIIRNDVLFTIGEDSLICIWSLNGLLLNKLFAHHGARIWSIHISEDNKTIFTGGADGAVHTWPFISTPNNNLQIISSFKTSSRIPKYVTYLNSGTLLIFHDGGMLECYDDALHLRESQYLEIYSSYCIMKVSSCRCYVCFASMYGHITIYTEINKENKKYLHQILEKKIMKSKIFSLQWLKNDRMLVCGEHGALRILAITPNNELYIHSEYILPYSREGWITAAIIYKNLLVCGDRAGNLYIFEMHDQSLSKTNVDKNISKPIQTIYKVHGKIGVQLCAVLNKKLITAGRNGMIKFYDIFMKNNRNQLRTLYSIKMPMDWISNILNINDDVLITGFKEVEFIIYSLHHQRIAVKYPCGGGHRSVDCLILNENIKFAYIRDKKIYLSSHHLNSLFLSTPTILNGFHVKEIYNVQPIINLIDQKIYVSGGEDCKLRLTHIYKSQLKRKDYTFKTLNIMDGHISSIKSIAIFNLKNTDLTSTYLIFSCGGRAQIKCWQMDIRWDNDDDDVLSNDNVSCIDLNSHMLFGLDQNRRKQMQKAKQTFAIESETRYMDIKVYCPSLKSTFIFLVIACADGYLRLFIYNILRKDIHPILYTKCTARCILKVHVLELKNIIIIMTMSTDGIVRYYNFTDIFLEASKNMISGNSNLQNIDIIPFAIMKLHQSGINSYDLKTITEDKYLLVTGGDDNLLCLVLFQISILEDATVSVEILSKHNISSIHYAQITGVKITNNKIFSVGIDQQVIIHTYSYNNNKILAQLLSTEFTSVSDVQGMVLSTSMKSNDIFLFIYGNGFEFLSV